MTNHEIAQKLRTHNEWRRGEGKFSEGGCKMPFEPKELGELIELAAKRLDNAQLMTEIMFDVVAGDDHARDRGLKRRKKKDTKTEKTQKRSRRK